MNHCKDCPLGILSIQEDIELWRNLGYSESYIDDFIEDIENNIHCDKLEGKVWWSNSLGCEGVYDEPTNIKPKQKSNKKKLTTRERNIKYNNKLKRMYDNQSYKYICYSEKIESDNGKIYYIKRHKSRNGRDFCQTYQKHSNNKIRNYLKRYDLSNGKCHKKVFDYCFTIN